MKFEREGSYTDTAYVRHTNAEIVRLALAFHDNETFGSWMLKSHERHRIYSIFLPLLFLDDIERKLMESDGCSEVYGEPGTRTDVFINGVPCFTGCRGIDAEDLLRLEVAMGDVRHVWRANIHDYC